MEDDQGSECGQPMLTVQCPSHFGGCDGSRDPDLELIITMSMAVVRVRLSVTAIYLLFRTSSKKRCTTLYVEMFHYESWKVETN